MKQTFWWHMEDFFSLLWLSFCITSCFYCNMCSSFFIFLGYIIPWFGRILCWLWLKIWVSLTISTFIVSLVALKIENSVDGVLRVLYLFVLLSMWAARLSWTPGQVLVGCPMLQRLIEFLMSKVIFVI